MKITYFTNEYPKVSHSFIRREILALERQGIEVQRIALRGWDGPAPDEMDRQERSRTRYVLRNGATSLLWPALKMMIGSPRRFFSALHLAFRMSRNSDRPLPYHLVYVAEACRIIPWMREFGTQHVHAHFGTNSAEVITLARVLGGPTFSFTVHGPDEFLRPMSLDEKVRHSAFVVAISSFGRSQLYMRTAYPDWPKVKVVHCGLEADFFNSDVTPLPESPHLLCVGRLCEAKGQLLLVEAAGRLAAGGIAFQLVLAGDGPMRADIEKLIAQYNLAGKVRITGWISSDQVREEIIAARAMVLPTFAEGLPVVIMEALALGRPVLTTFVAGIPELVEHGINGWLIPAGSIVELEKALSDCLARPLGEMQALGEAGRSRVMAQHSIDTEAAKLAQLFRDTVASGAGS